jgi:hypothetical protein
MLQLNWLHGSINADVFRSPRRELSASAMMIIFDPQAGLETVKFDKYLVIQFENEDAQ